MYKIQKMPCISTRIVMLVFHVLVYYGSLFYWEELIISVQLTSHSRLISVKSPARFLEWQRELSLMFDSRNVCGTWRGRGKCLSVFVFQSRIFSHVFFPSYIQALCNTDVPNSPDTCIKLLYCRLLVVWVSGHLHGGNRTPDCCLCLFWQYDNISIHVQQQQER